MDDYEQFWDENEPMAAPKLDDYDPTPFALSVEQTNEGEIPSYNENMLKTTTNLNIPEYAVNASQDNQSNITSPPFLPKSTSKKMSKNSRHEEYKKKNIPDKKNTQTSGKKGNKERNIPNLSDLFQEEPAALEHERPIKGPFLNANQESVLQNAVTESQIPSNNSLIDSSQATTSQYVLPIKEDPIDDTQNSNFPFSGGVKTRVVESLLNQVSPSNTTVLQSENLVPDRPINVQAPITANVFTLSQETNNPSPDKVKTEDPSSQSNGKIMPSKVDQIANRGVKRLSSLGSEEDKSTPPSKKNKEMNKYKQFEETADEKDKLMIYNRIRNFMRHSQRKRGYVELRDRNLPLLAFTKNILVENTYHPLPKEGEDAELAKAMTKLNQDTWITMMLEDEVKVFKEIDENMDAETTQNA